MLTGNIVTASAALLNETIDLVPRIVFAAIVFAVFFVVAKVTERLVRAAMSRTSTTGHVDFVVSRFTYIGVLVFGSLAALSLVVNVTALVTSLGLAGFAIGFAVKDILGNSLSGILILTQRPFVIGDQIEVEGIEGRVEDVRVRDTVILTAEGRSVYIPNSKIFTGIITNNSVNKLRLVSCTVSVSLDADFGEVRSLILKALTGVEGVLAKPEPCAIITSMGEKSAVAELKFWVNTKKTNPAVSKSDAYSAIKPALENAGIKTVSE